MIIVSKNPVAASSERFVYTTENGTVFYRLQSAIVYEAAFQGFLFGEDVVIDVRIKAKEENK